MIQVEISNKVHNPCGYRQLRLARKGNAWQRLEDTRNIVPAIIVIVDGGWLSIRAAKKKYGVRYLWFVDDSSV